MPPNEPRGRAGVNHKMAHSVSGQGDGKYPITVKADADVTGASNSVALDPVPTLGDRLPREFAALRPAHNAQLRNRLPVDCLIGNKASATTRKINKRLN